LKRDFEDNFGGTKIGSILVTGDDLKFQPFTIPAESAQLIEQQRWTVEDVARAFGVPLYKIGAGSTPALSNISALNQEYYQQTLQPHIEGIETLMDDGLGLGAGLGIEFDLDGLLRMDPKSRAEVHEIGVRSATLMPNEARLQENRPPSEGGNALYLQQQNYSLPALAKRDASDDPFGKAPTTAAAPPANDPEAGAEDDDAEAVRSTISRFRSREWRANSRN
jgi:phage portal protein BeeE